MFVKKRGGGILSLLGINGSGQSSAIDQEGFYYEQIASIVGAGGWTLDFMNKTSYFDKQLRKILETPENYRPSLNHALHFYDMGHHDLVREQFETMLKGIPVEHVVKMTTYSHKTFWARVIGKPILSPKNKVIGVKGVIINVDSEKKKEIEFENSFHTVEANNTRLFKFAEYVSKNLKSHVNNLELTSELIDENTLTTDQKELFKNYRQIATRISKTVHQLNEVVSIQNKAGVPRVPIDLDEALERAKLNLQLLISSEDVMVYSDFSEAPVIHYIPTFLDNMLTILIANGIKNKKAGRTPEIKAYTLEDNDSISLILEDNGAGIDMDRDGDALFAMSGSRDFLDSGNTVGLFIIKNQVEALGGRIEIESRLGYGTKFIVHF